MICSKPLAQCNSISCWVHNCGAMRGVSKVKRGNKVSGLAPDNKKDVETCIKANTIIGDYTDLIILLADIADLMAKGENIWVTFGLTFDKTGYLLTVNWDADKIRASGGSLREVAKEAALLV